MMWTKHGSENCPYEDENACVDAWVAVHREQLDRFTEKELADLAAESPEDYTLNSEASGTRLLRPDLPEQVDPTPRNGRRMNAPALPAGPRSGDEAGYGDNR